MTETVPPKQIHIKLPPYLHQALKLEAAYNNKTVQELVVDLIMKRIANSEFSGFLPDEN